MKLTLKREELVALNFVLLEIAKNIEKEKYDKRFNYAVHRNIEYFEPEIKSIQEAQKEPDVRIQEYQQKLQDIGRECADKDENGNPKLIKKGNSEVFDIKIKQEEAKQKTNKLIEEYKDVIEQHKENLKQFQELMNENVEIDICKVSFQYFPDKYDISEHKILEHIIKETPEEIEAML